MKIASLTMNTENKSNKKNWLKPQILLLDTGYVEGGAQPGHYENNPSHFDGANWTLQNPTGNQEPGKHNSKHFYQS